MAIDLAYIDEFLARVEGPCQRCGYVPARRLCDGRGRNYIGADGVTAPGVPHAASGDPAAFAAMGASGVTIATGCDLGQTDAGTLAAYGLDAGIATRFGPYLGRRKAAALKALHIQPLRLGEAEARAVDAAVHAGYLRRHVIPAWERAAPAAFAELPREAQAVIMSCCFQKGCGGVRRDWPKLWGHLIRLDWQAAANELTRGFTQYRERRAAEGRLLATL